MLQAPLWSPKGRNLLLFARKKDVFLFELPIFFDPGGSALESGPMLVVRVHDVGLQRTRHREVYDVGFFEQGVR